MLPSQKRGPTRHRPRARAMGLAHVEQPGANVLLYSGGRDDNGVSRCALWQSGRYRSVSNREGK